MRNLNKVFRVHEKYIWNNLKLEYAHIKIGKNSRIDRKIPKKIFKDRLINN
jgi:hypothetical protein